METYYVYKITCLVNGKVYIGQTIQPIRQRFKRHIRDAVKGKLNTKFACAIRKYGEENFTIELLDDSATSQEELTQLEYKYIKEYNSVKDGYNSTDDMHKCGGNTYKNIDITETRKKLHDMRLGGQNPMAKKVKIIDYLENTEIIKNSMAEAKEFLNLNNHQHISRRCLHKIKSLLFGRYWFEYA